MRARLAAILGGTVVACLSRPPPPSATIDARLPTVDGRAPDAGSDTTPNYVFVTSIKTQPGVVMTGAAADQICHDAAQNHLPGTYVAWVSTMTENARARLGAAQGWIRPDDKPFANTLPDVIAGRILYPPRITELMTDVGDDGTPVMTGTLASGSAGSNCVGCGSQVTAGLADAGNHAWTSAMSLSTATAMRLYCFQIDHQITPQPLPLTGKHVWVKTLVSSPVSIMELDGGCKTDHPGAVALVSDGEGDTAIDRLVSTGPWTRFDGVEVFPADKTKIEAPIDLTVGDTYTSGSVWSGSPAFDMAGSAGDSCNAWQGTGTVLLGDATRSSSSGSFSGGGTGSCATAGTYALYCADP